MSAGVYVACPLACVLHARKTAMVLKGLGVSVCSRWHGVAQPGDVDPITESGRRRIVYANVEDLNGASLLLALTDSGMPRATYCEIGYALAQSVPVVWVQGQNMAGANIFDAHPGVSVVFSWDEGIALVVRTLKGEGAA